MPLLLLPLLPLLVLVLWIDQPNCRSRVIGVGGSALEGAIGVAVGVAVGVGGGGFVSGGVWVGSVSVVFNCFVPVGEGAALIGS